MCSHVGDRRLVTTSACEAASRVSSPVRKPSPRCEAPRSARHRPTPRNCCIGPWRTGRLTPQLSGRALPCPCAAHAHNEMARVRRARDVVSRSAATACYAPRAAPSRSALRQRLSATSEALLRYRGSGARSPCIAPTADWRTPKTTSGEVCPRALSQRSNKTRVGLEANHMRGQRRSFALPRALSEPVAVETTRRALRPVSRMLSSLASDPDLTHPMLAGTETSDPRNLDASR